MVIQFDHLAYVTESMDGLLSKHLYLSEKAGEVNVFPGEGTKEVYIGKPDQCGKLLIMEPIDEGVYLDWFKKRGKGIHHLAINVPSLEMFCREILSSGWHLHPYSLESMEYRTIWLTRAFTPLLIEVHEKSFFSENPGYIEKVYYSQYISQKLMDSLQLDLLIQSETNHFYVQIEGEKKDLSTW